MLYTTSEYCTTCGICHLFSISFWAFVTLPMSFAMFLRLTMVALTFQSRNIIRTRITDNILRMPWLPIIGLIDLNLSLKVTDNTGVHQGASGNDVTSMCMATTSFMFSSISFSRASCSPDSLAVATKQWSGFKPWSWQEYFHLEKIWFCSLATPDCSMARYEWKCADVINLFQF